MTTLFEKKSCAACAKSKRKCGRQTPSCARCQARGLPCTYPASKPTCWVVSSYMPPDQLSNTAPTTPILYSSEVPTSEPPLPSAALPASPLFASPYPLLDPSPFAPLTLTDDQLPWFLTPQTWTIHPIPHEDL